MNKLITDYAGREIFARRQNENLPVVTYYFRCKNPAVLEAVTFDTRSGFIVAVKTICITEFVLSNAVLYYNGSAVPSHPCSGSHF
jgi:hypothetical protein